MGIKTVSVHLLIQTVGQHPVFLPGMKEQTLDIEGEPVFLIGGPFIRTDQYAAFHFRITKKHDLKIRKRRKERVLVGENKERN